MRNHSFSPSARQKAFTLIEILVVIAIISLLAAILFPVFSRSRENARRSSCSTSMRFMALGIRQYAQDYDERMPLVAVNDTPSAAQCYGWQDGILPYTKSPLAFQCLSDPTFPPTTITAGHNVIYEEDGINDYYYNTRLHGIEEAKLITSPSIIMIGEGRGIPNALAPYVTGTPPATPEGTGRNTYDGGTASGFLAPNSVLGNTRHLLGTNYAFADGHMKWLQPQQITAGGAPAAAGIFTFGVG